MLTRKKLKEIIGDLVSYGSSDLTFALNYTDTCTCVFRSVVDTPAR